MSHFSYWHFSVRNTLKRRSLGEFIETFQEGFMKFNEYYATSLCLLTLLKDDLMTCEKVIDENENYLYILDQNQEFWLEWDSYKSKVKEKLRRKK